MSWCMKTFYCIRWSTFRNFPYHLRNFIHVGGSSYEPVKKWVFFGENRDSVQNFPYNWLLSSHQVASIWPKDSSWLTFETHISLSKLSTNASETKRSQHYPDVLLPPLMKFVKLGTLESEECCSEVNLLWDRYIHNKFGTGLASVIPSLFLKLCQSFSISTLSDLLHRYQHFHKQQWRWQTSIPKILDTLENHFNTRSRWGK